MPQRFKIILPSELADEIDGTFSPMDGIVALDEIYLEMPQLHRPISRFGFHRKTFHGRYDWYPLGFTYQQISNELHIRKVWDADENRLFRRHRFDVILGKADGGFSLRDEPKEEDNQ